MAYKGGDLDLRTPRTWSASSAEAAPPSYYEQSAPRVRGSYAPGPIWVDEVVLACVNHAYDVALAHRSGEVRLEHLLHALTRIDAAAEALEARGVRVAALRRESATVIASELPVGLTNGKGTPRHSEELEHVLRVASNIASRRNAPASVEDVLHLMLDLEPDLPGLTLLTRVSPRGPAGNEPTYVRPPSSYTQTYYASETRVPTPATPAPPPAPRAQRGGYRDSAVDNIQNSRLDALEQMVRALSADLGAERQTFSGLLQDLQRDVTGIRSSSSSIDVGPVVDRVATIERSVTAGFEQLTLAIASIENDLRTRTGQGGAPLELAPIASRLEIIEEAVLSRDSERAMQNLAERFDRLETTLASERTRMAEAGAVLRGEVGSLAQAIDTQRAELMETFVTPMTERFAQVTATVESRQAEAAESFRLLSERLEGLQTLVGDMSQKAGEAQTSNREEMAVLQDALVKLNANQHTLAGTINQWRAEARQAADILRSELKQGTEVITADVKSIVPRFATLESEAQKLGGMVEGLSGTVDNMHRVTVERYFRRNRMRYWLFGTDDWVAASWPSQSHRIAEELKAVKAPHRR